MEKKILSETVDGLNSKELLKIAKGLNIVGRHDMKKDQLLAVIKVAIQDSLQKEEFSKELTFEDKLAASEEIKVEVEWEESPTIEIGTRTIPRGKDSYIDDAKVGMIIAFKINNVKVISGMIEEIHKLVLVVKTKNGVRFTVRKKDVVWVKTGPRWPRGVYLALKGEIEADEGKRPN